MLRAVDRPVQVALFEKRHPVRILIILACLVSCRRGRAAIRKVCGVCRQSLEKKRVLFWTVAVGVIQPALVVG